MVVLLAEVCSIRADPLIDRANARREWPLSQPVHVDNRVGNVIAEVSSHVTTSSVWIDKEKA
jgi:hypothetical protein